MNEGDRRHGMNALERDCVLRFVGILAGRLADNLAQVWLFGSAARSEIWPNHLPQRSDIDLLVLTREPIGQEEITELVNATYPLFLECGRQIAPQFRTLAWISETDDERDRRFISEVRRDGCMFDIG